MMLLMFCFEKISAAVYMSEKTVQQVFGQCPKDHTRDKEGDYHIALF
jgi:hypothetical protein